MKFVAPVEIEVYGVAPKKKLVRWLHQASVLHLKTDQFGNGPRECLILPTINWGLMRRIAEDISLKEIPTEEWWEAGNENE